MALQIRKIYLHTSWIKVGSSVTRMTLPGLNLLFKTFITAIKKNMKWNSIWIPAKGIIYLILGEICMNLQLVNIKWYLNYTSSLHLLTTHQLTYHPQVVLRQFPGCRSLGRVRVWDQALLSELVDQTFIIYNPRHQ